MPASRCPGGSTPRAARPATAPGISPSPQALSTGPGRGSRTSTSRPARAAYSAVTSPTGPPPATTRSRTGRLAGEGGQGGVLDPDPHAEQDRVEHREDHGGDPPRVDQGQGDALHDDRDVVGVRHQRVGAAAHGSEAGYDDHAGVPL